MARRSVGSKKFKLKTWHIVVIGVTLAAVVGGVAIYMYMRKGKKAAPTPIPVMPPAAKGQAPAAVPTTGAPLPGTPSVAPMSTPGYGSTPTMVGSPPMGATAPYQLPAASFARISYN